MNKTERELSIKFYHEAQNILNEIRPILIKHSELSIKLEKFQDENKHFVDTLKQLKSSKKIH